MSTPNIDYLRGEVTKLKALLDDPQPGLPTWVEAYRVQMQKVTDFFSDAALSAADYEEVLESKRALVRQLDVALHGDGAAKQASLVDLVARIPAEFNALRQDFADMRGRFCKHHGTPGAVRPGCPECARDFLRGFFGTIESRPNGYYVATRHGEKPRSYATMQQMIDEESARDSA